ncbi:MAG: hypothetical protein AB7C96_10920 [Hydrogenovibrio sp.]
MKLSYVFLIIAFLFGQLQVAGAAVPVQKMSSEAPAHACCDEMTGMHHDMHSAHKTAHQMSSHSTQTTGHACCDHTMAFAGCPMCGDQCDCGVTCHITSHSFGVIQTVAIRMAPMVVKTVEPSDFSFVSAELALEKRPPKHA